MPVTLEVSYFNSYYVKRLADVPYIPSLAVSRTAVSSGTITKGSLVTFGSSLSPVVVGMFITGAGITLSTRVTAVDGSGNGFKFDQDVTVTSGSLYSFGYDWTGPQVANEDEDWYIEESRIRGGYNNTSTDYGVKAYIVEEQDAQTRRGNSLIYSGIFNSRTGINQSNQFSVAEEITRSVDPISGSIQKLFAEDTNLLIFQERKVNNALIDKDAIFTAEGQAITTSGRLVIGQITPIAGNWGISKDPQSFAVYGYKKYFVDRNRNAVLRLAGGNITEISNYGMIDFFRDTLSSVTSTGVILGAYDNYSQNYVISLQPFNRYEPDGTSFKTLTFDERSQGWTSFFTFKPDAMFSSQGYFYSAKTIATTLASTGGVLTATLNDGDSGYDANTVYPTTVQGGGSGTGCTVKVLSIDGGGGILTFSIEVQGSGYTVGQILELTGGDESGAIDVASLTPGPIKGLSNIYKHNTNATRNSFYGITPPPSSIQFVFNPSPNNIKTFQTINYEGTSGWEVSALVSDETGFDSSQGNWINHIDTIVEGAGATQYRKIYSYVEGAYVEDGIQYRAGFDRKQNKYMAVIPNNTQTPIAGEVVFGNSMTGIKAYYATVTMKTDATTDPNGLKELFTVSSVFV